MRILAGGPARETESDLFKLHYESLERQTVAKDHFLTIRHEIVPDPGGNRWNHDKIERVAKVRQKFLDMHEFCRRDTGHSDRCYYALFMVDTDVIVGPHVLERLMKVEADVVYGVFWTQWEGFDESMPQVWDIHYYDHRPDTRKFLAEVRTNPRSVVEREVLGGGACTLIRGRGFESRYYPLLQSLKMPGTMMYGEDRTFALGLETRNIRQVAVFGLPIYHLDKPRLQTPEKLAQVRQELGL